MPVWSVDRFLEAVWSLLHRRHLRLIALLGMLVLMLATSARPATAQTYFVTSTKDAGPGTLRQALLDSNAGNRPGQFIVFSLPGGDEIALESPLPPVTGPVTIDGYSTPGIPGPAVNPPIRVMLDGRGVVPVGLDVRGSGVVVRGLAFGGFGIGVRIAGPANTVRIEGTRIGTDASGTVARGNGVGIAVVADGGAPSSIAIGTQLDQTYGNLIAANGDGVVIDARASNISVSGNRIGTNAASTARMGNGRGIVVTGDGPTGTDIAIGGNVIAGNTGAGVTVRRGSGVRIDSNYIGLTEQEVAYANEGDGIVLGDAGAGTAVDAAQVRGNLVAYNGGAGIVVQRGSGNALHGNRIWNNGGLGIDLGDDGVDGQDAGDGDAGPNGRQNAPVLQVAWPGVQATLTGTPNTSFTATMYASLSCDPSGHGQGQRALTESYPRTDANGRAEFALAGQVPPGFTAIAALVTSAVDGSSEFSNCVVLSQPTGSLSGIVTLDGAPLAGVRVTLSGDRSAEVTTGADGRYLFSGLPVGGTYMVAPSRDDYAFSPTAVSSGVLASGGVTQQFLARRSLTLTGFLRGADEGGLPGIPVYLTGAMVATAHTDADGRYRFSGLALDGTYEVRPDPTSLTFSPVSRTFSQPPQSPSLTETGFTAVSGTFVRYLAEGATGTFFDTRIEMLNATSTDSSATLQFLRGDGTRVDHHVTVQAHSLATVRPATITALESAEFSTVVVSSGPLTVDRTMTWNGTGYGSHAETAVPAPATRWYLAEGATISGFNLFYLLQNPWPFPVSVSITYLRPSEPPLPRLHVLPPNSRTNIWVNLEDPRLASAEVSGVIDATFPIIVERAMYRDIPGQVFGAGHASAGITEARTSWFLAEGNTGPYFDLFVLVANPSSSAAPITATFLLPDGSTRAKTYVVPAQSRFSIWVDEEELPAGSGLKPLANTAVSTTIASTDGIPIIVERAMWWPGSSATWQEGHNTPAAGRTGTKWAVAGGQSGGPFGAETYLLVANTSTTGGTVRVTLYFEDGTTAVREFPVLPTSRLNVAVAAEFAESAGRRYGAVVESLGTAPAAIVVERATYSSAGGRTWAAGSVSLAARLR